MNVALKFGKSKICCITMVYKVELGLVVGSSTVGMELFQKIPLNFF
jgi:hypothetical protein